jgi:C4-dicarboxylate transporter DctM subunit
MIMDTMAAIVLLAPILLNVVVPMGYDPVHFGLIMIINLAIGFLTPPLGVNLFVANAISNVKSERIFTAVFPFIISSLTVLLLIIFVPWFSLFLPNLFYGK